MEFYGAFSDETGASAFRHRSFGAATGSVVRSRPSVQQSPQAIFEMRGVSPSPCVRGGSAVWRAAKAGRKNQAPGVTLSGPADALGT